MSIDSTQQSTSVSGLMDTSRAGLDKETRLMLLCYGLLNILDGRMTDQMDIMQARNARATQLKGVLTQLNEALAKFEANAKPDAELTADKFSDGKAADGTLGNAGEDFFESLEAKVKQVNIPGLSDLVKDGKLKKSDLDAAVSKVTGVMDSNSSIQQLEMFTLQSVFSKRNEVFELMSNSMKKCQDTKSTLVRNF